MSKPRKILVGPSILAADPLNFESELRDIEACGGDYHHVDVMDGNFVPNLTYGIPLVAAIKRKTSIPIDVHLMIINPEQMALRYVEAGAALVSFHVETCTHTHRLIQAVKDKGVKVGVALNPGSPLALIEPLLSAIDFVNIMSVNPGFSGQKFIPESVSKIALLYDKLKNLGLSDQVNIEVDGGINETTAKSVVQAGASMLVAGNYVYLAQDRKHAIDTLHNS